MNGGVAGPLLDEDPDIYVGTTVKLKVRTSKSPIIRPQ